MSNQIPLSVQMTTEGAVVCQCCKKLFPPGTELAWIHSSDRAHGGRNCCQECAQYYKRKKQGISSQREYNYKSLQEYKSEKLTAAVATSGDITQLDVAHAARVHDYNNAAQQGAGELQCPLYKYHISSMDFITLKRSNTGSCFNRKHIWIWFERTWSQLECKANATSASEGTISYYAPYPQQPRP